MAALRHLSTACWSGLLRHLGGKTLKLHISLEQTVTLWKLMDLVGQIAMRIYELQMTGMAVNSFLSTL